MLGSFVFRNVAGYSIARRTEFNDRVSAAHVDIKGLDTHRGFADESFGCFEHGYAGEANELGSKSVSRWIRMWCSKVPLVKIDVEGR